MITLKSYLINQIYPIKEETLKNSTLFRHRHYIKAGDFTVSTLEGNNLLCWEYSVWRANGMTRAEEYRQMKFSKKFNTILGAIIHLTITKCKNYQERYFGQ